VPRRPLPDDAAEHHWRDGWYFRRLSDGAVRIRYAGRPSPAPLETDIPADEWAAIVQHVAAPIPQATPEIETGIHHPPPPPPTPEAPKKKRRTKHR